MDRFNAETCTLSMIDFFVSFRKIFIRSFWSHKIANKKDLEKKVISITS